MRKCMTIAAAAAVVLACGSGVQANVVIDTVPVGNPGNPGELSGEGAGGWGPDAIVGGVDYVYNIGKYEVTAGEYTEFLNAVAATDTYGLYNINMWSATWGCKIQRNGNSGSYIYGVDADWADRPVNYVSFWDAARFANWMGHGQPTGVQGPATTEDGSYTLNGYTGPYGSWIARNPGSTWVIPTEDEWYKAAYHKNDGVTGNYYEYPTGTDAEPSNELIDPDPGNNANFWHGGPTIGYPYYRTEVGEFENSGSPYGTLDQGGNVLEWNETVIGSSRGARGGSFDFLRNVLHATYRIHDPPSNELQNNGFRFAYVPEPATIVMLAFGGVVVLGRK